MTTTNAKIGEWIELNDGGRSVLEIVSGKVELYVVYKSVRRVFLWEEETGDFLYGIPAHINVPELCLVAIAIEETTLRSIPLEDFRTSERALRVDALEDALTSFFHRPDRHLLPRVCREIPPGEKETLPEGTRIAAGGICQEDARGEKWTR